MGSHAVQPNYRSIELHLRYKMYNYFERSYEDKIIKILINYIKEFYF